MPADAIPTLSIDTPERAFAEALGASLRRYGFAVVADHGIDPALIARGWGLTEAFFALPEARKRRWYTARAGGARGYTPFRTEIAKGAAAHDLKEFWHIGRDLPAGHPHSATMPPNVWPDAPGDFRETFTALFAAFDRVGARLLSAIATDLGLPADWFAAPTTDGNSVLRLLHYPPLADAPADALRAAPHEDINLITLLLGAEEAGLELLSRDGAWLPVSPPPAALVVNIGDMLARLSNDVLPSTTHRVRNPSAERTGHSRYAMPFFHHLAPDFLIATLPGCISARRPNRYAQPITADASLQQRLREIGLRG